MPACAPAPAPGIGAAEIGDAACRLHRHENATQRLRIRSLVGRIAKVDEKRARPAIAVETDMPPTAASTTSWTSRTVRP